MGDIDWRLEAADWQRTSESWRRAHVAWQDWAERLCRDLDAHPEGGLLGDEPAREAIGAAARHSRGKKGPVVAEPNWTDLDLMTMEADPHAVRLGLYDHPPTLTRLELAALGLWCLRHAGVPASDLERLAAGLRLSLGEKAGG